MAIIKRNQRHRSWRKANNNENIITKYRRNGSNNGSEEMKARSVRKHRKSIGNERRMAAKISRRKISIIYWRNMAKRKRLAKEKHIIERK